MTFEEATQLLAKDYEVHFDGDRPYLQYLNKRASISVSLFNSLLRANVVGLRGGKETVFVISDWARKHAGQFRAQPVSPAN